MESPGTTDYMLLMRGSDWGHSLSPREAQEGLETMMAWVEDLRRRGILFAGQPLASTGSIISAKADSITDGPFVETKEAVGGYLMFRTTSLEEAENYAKQCPVLKYGLVIELRPMIGQCPMGDEFGLAYTALSA